jgi:hypothetical protein
VLIGLENIERDRSIVTLLSLSIFKTKLEISPGAKELWSSAFSI